MGRQDWTNPRNIAQPQPGLFKLRLVKYGPWVPAKIVHDEATGLWGAEINGAPAGLPDVDWTRARGVAQIWTSGREVTPAEYAYLVEVAEWARAHQEHPAHDPTRPIDLSALPTLF